MAPTKKRLDLGFFAPISKEEMERRSELEFAVLNNKLEKERSMTKHALPKRPVGRPMSGGLVKTHSTRPGMVEGQMCSH
jgi:hypothetical protein